MTPRGVTFVCFACDRRFGENDANLDAEGNLICGDCYVADPPPEDVEGIFAEVMAHTSDEERPRAGAINGFCRDCGRKTYNGRCPNGC